MKTYTHPTINLPAGAVVVKFYCEVDSGTETLTDMIEEIGDVTYGFDVNLGDLYVESCSFLLHNVNNDVLSKLFFYQDLAVSVVVASKNYFYGQVDFTSLEVEDENDPSSDNHFSRVRFNAISYISWLKHKTIAECKSKLGGYTGSVSGGYYYLREYFRAMAEFMVMAYALTTDVEYLVARKYQITETLLTDYELKDILINLDYFDSASYENNYTEICENGFDLFALICKDFFLIPQIIYDSTAGKFKLKLIERDNGTVITLPNVRKKKPSTRFLIRQLSITLKNIPETLPTSSLVYSYNKTYGYYGDSFDHEHSHTNIARDNTTTASAGGTLTTSPITISVARTDFLNNSGDAVIIHSGTPKTFSYTGKTGSTLTGCTITSGSFAFSSGDVVQRDDYNYSTNLLLYLKNSLTGLAQLIEYVENPDTISSASFHAAIVGAYKNIYYDNEKWMWFEVVGLSADGDVHKLYPGYVFAYEGRNYLIHEVTKSLMNNVSSISALDIGAA